MSRNLNFTQAAIDRLSLPNKRVYYRDTKESGLILDVRPSGSKSFYLYKKINGRPERIFLGQYPDMKIPQARKAAAIKKGEIADGKNPQEEKRNVRQEITFGEFFDEYMERYSKLHKRSWEYDIREVNKYLSHWFNRKLSSITRHEVQRLHQTIGAKNGKTQANRILERVRGIYNKAIEWGWDGANPAAGIKKYKEIKRDRFIQPNEFPFIFEALSIEENQTARDYIFLLLMTGARKTNVLAMRWVDINWERKVWRIPQTKNGEPLSVPLIDDAIELLEKLRQKTNSQWVFPSEKGSGHLVDPKKAWDRIRRRATLAIWRQIPDISEMIAEVEEKLSRADNYGYTSTKLISAVKEEAAFRKFELPIGVMDVRIHDLRRTMGSYQAMTGASLPIIGKTLGHKSSLSTQVYARLNDDPIRESMNKAASAIFEFAKE